MMNNNGSLFFENVQKNAHVTWFSPKESHLDDVTCEGISPLGYCNVLEVHLPFPDYDS